MLEKLWILPQESACVNLCKIAFIMGDLDYDLLILVWL